MKKLSPETISKRCYQILEEIESPHKELQSLKDRCSHIGSIVYSPDPSGNNDSSYDCIACESSWRNYPKDVLGGDHYDQYDYQRPQTKVT